MSELRIITNNVPRPLLGWWDLDEGQQLFVRTEYDWLWDNDTMTNEDEYYIQYRGWLYCLSDFMRVNEKSAGCPFGGWDGYSGDTFFSGVLLRMVEDAWDGPAVVMAHYYQ